MSLYSVQSSNFKQIFCTPEIYIQISTHSMKPILGLKDLYLGL